MFRRFIVTHPLIAAMAALAILTLSVIVGSSLATSSGTDAVVGSDAPSTSDPRAEPLRPEVAGERLIQGLELTGEFGFVLYDSVKDRPLIAYRADQVHYSQSVVKLLIAVGALEQEGADVAAVTEMLARSDDDIASELWGQLNGPALIEQQALAMDLRYTEPSPDWGRWGDTQISASDVVRIYEFLRDESPERERQIIFDALAAIEDRGADGFDQTFGLPAAADGLDSAVNQGWGCCKPDRFLVSTGMVGADYRYSVAIFGGWDETQVDERSAADEMTALADALLDAVPLQQ